MSSPRFFAQAVPGLPPPVRRREPRHAAVLRWALAGVAALVLGACSERASQSTPQATDQAAALASSGQVASGSTPKVSFYAASRFADQASFGPTPELVAELQAKGFEAWLDEQFALPVEDIDPTPLEHWTTGKPVDFLFSRAYFQTQFGRRAIASRDQLRLRVSYSLGNWIVVPVTNGTAVGGVVWFNLLQKHAFGRFDVLLRAASTNPSMGSFLGNAYNRPRSEACPTCAPNENFARELMQLFSIGTVLLNPDGTSKKDGAGRPIESYTQRDVAELARVLTGWQFDPDPPGRHYENHGNWRKPMVPSPVDWERDTGPKTVLGRAFPAGQSAAKDLDDAIELLTRHPNTAPFVALRMIQHLVTSDPTPAYLGRVAAVFRDNGRGQVGDLKAVIKATLLDPEARAGDVRGHTPARFGKLREPALMFLATFRGMGCERMPDVDTPDGVLAVQAWDHRYLDPLTVFGYYQPTDRAPGSGIVAPEHELLTASEFADRIGRSTLPSVIAANRYGEAQRWRVHDEAGCDLALFRQALSRSHREFADLVGRRFFRGAPPATLTAIVDSLRQRQPNGHVPFTDPEDGAIQLIGILQLLPEYGVIL